MVAISSKFGLNGQRRPLAVRRRISATRKRTPTMWIGMSMFCLVILYFAIVVLVTRYHWPDHEGTLENNTEIKLSKPEINRPDAPNIDNRKAFKDKLKDAKDKKDEEKKKKPNPVRRHHLDLEFGAGVEPHKLAQHNAPVSIMADKEDPPTDKHPTPDNILTAYLEPLNYDDWEIGPLPIRSQAKAENLKPITYSRLNSCSRLMQQWPVDAPDTPTDHDPFLPWIHDVFPTADGKYIQFVAQNKRRCKTGSKEKDILAHMSPQASLFQHVSVKRMTSAGHDTRYRLVSHEDADADGLATRFICRFKPSMQETLSEFNFDYEWTAYRKRYKVFFEKDDGGIKHIHISQLLFRCPVPENLQETVRTGSSVQNDWASLFVDLVPIRTAPRWGSPNQYLPPRYAQFQDLQERFDPVKSWGDDHVLPLIQDSGRWENIPICKPSLQQYENPDDKSVIPETPQKKHRLVSCLWASAGYTTRGNRFAVNDGQRRLLEWITYNKLIGFDHFYVYDNSGAFGNDTSLKPIADLFPGQVTYIPWPSQVCNNNPNNVDSVGERSSQYAAESSCRLRFGPHVEWIGQFDIDEYLVPMGNHNNITSLLDELETEDTRIISFGSWRAWPRWAFVDEPERIEDPQVCWSREPCFELKIPMKHTMLQAYNCDRQKPGQKTSTMPAEKQLYKPDYVLQHFVHYSSATVLSEMNRAEYAKEGFRWKYRAFPDPRQRFANELEEGLMIHTKAVARQDTAGWERVCHIDNLKRPKRSQGLCRLGVPWPADPEEAMKNATKEGWAYNCYVNDKVEKYHAPRLAEKLKEHAHIFDTQ